MIDISAVGSFVRIEFAGGGSGGGSNNWTITEFSDEGTPFECPDVDLSTNQKNLNGQMISSRTPSVYTLSVTVIPGSADDLWLMKRAQEAALMPGSIYAIENLKVKAIELAIPNINESAASSGQGSQSSWHSTYRWTNGRMKSAPTGPSTSAEGRLSARTYTFEMEKFDPPKGYGTDVDSASGITG